MNFNGRGTGHTPDNMRSSPQGSPSGSPLQSPASVRGDEQPNRKGEFVDEQVRLYRMRLSPHQFSAGEAMRTVFVFGLPVSWSSNTLKQICQLKVSAPTVKVGAMAARV